MKVALLPLTKTPDVPDSTLLVVAPERVKVPLLVKVDDPVPKETPLPAVEAETMVPLFVADMPAVFKFITLKVMVLAPPKATPVVANCIIPVILTVPELLVMPVLI